MKRVGLFIVCLLAFGVVVAKGKDHQWQTGTLTAVADVVSPSINGTSQPEKEYTIETDGPTYVTREWPSYWLRRLNPASTAVGSKVQFYIDKNHLVLMGVDGREHKTDIVRTVPKKPQG
jgi:hypothetical protein